MARNLLNDIADNFDLVDPDLREKLEQQLLVMAGNMLPSDIDKQRLMQIMVEYGNCIWFIDEQSVGAMSKPKTLEKARLLLATWKLTEPFFDGHEIVGKFADLSHTYHPSIAFHMDEIECDCNEPTTRLCSHITALMLAWARDRRSFFSTNPSPDEQQALMDSEFGEFLLDVTGELDYTRALAKLMNDSAQSASTSTVATQGLASTKKSSTGKGNWPTASGSRITLPPLKETIEAEFNTAQLRELAKGFGVKLKGTTKSAYVEQVTTELLARTERMRETPEVLLEDLTDDQANLVRRALTARDYYLPLPRNLANNLWSQMANRDPDKRANDALDVLRRKAILFPTRNYVGYRDVYYQWLPLEASGGNVPLVKWPARPLLARNKPERPSPENHLNFLDAFELFIDALMSSGTEVRASLPRHPKTDGVQWLQSWEHDTKEAERLLNSRPGWVPNPSSGISVPLLSPLTPEARIVLEGQTGLSGAQCEFMFGIAAALQLIEAPDNYAKGTSAGKHLNTPWKINARTNTIEEWFALTDEDKFMRTWTAWRQLVLFAYEATHAAYAGRVPDEGPRFNVMRAIGAREFLPTDLAAEWASLRRYVTRVLCGLPKNEWIGWPELRKQLFEFYPDCQWTTFGQEQWWVNAPGKPIRLDLNRYEDWQQTIGAIVENIIAEPLRWFGAVEVDVVDNRLDAFRVTDLIDWLTQAQMITTIGATNDTLAFPRLPAYAQPRPRKIEPVTWMDHKRWHLPPAPDRAEFITFARMIGDPTDAPFTYALTPASVERAIAAGITVDEVMRQFDGIDAPLPVEAREMYTSIAERFGRVRLYESLTILQLADDYALRELLSATSLGQHVVYQISSRAVVVKAEAVDGLVEELITKGYTPGVK